jgi:hypothetical protein
MAASDKEFDTEVAKSLCFISALIGLIVLMYNTASFAFGISMLLSGAYFSGLCLIVCTPLAYPMVRHFYRRWQFFRKQIKYLTNGE